MMAGPRVKLRDWRPEDEPLFVGMNSDPLVMKFFARHPSPEESKAMLARIRATLAEKGWGLWALEVEEGFAGFVGLNVPGYETPFSPFVEVSWRLKPKYWGKGYATEAASLAMLHGFETARLKEIVSFTTLENRRSWAVMRRLGMQRDEAADFDHPLVESGHPLRRHCLYRLRDSEEARRRLRALLADCAVRRAEGLTR